MARASQEETFLSLLFLVSALITISRRIFVNTGYRSNTFGPLTLLESHTRSLGLFTILFGSFPTLPTIISDGTSKYYYSDTKRDVFIV